jgi:dihydropteroate synthase
LPNTFKNKARNQKNMKDKTIEGYFKDITISDDLENVKAEYSTEEYSNDPKGYFLIKANKEEGIIEVGYCSPDNILKKRITGKNPIEIFYTLIRLGLISKLEHAADTGSELQKAYIALKNNLEYTQDKDLNLNNPDQ